MSLLLAGGHADPNLGVLARAAQHLGIAITDLRIAADASPGFTWNLEDGTVSVDGNPVRPTAAFVRYDVFTSMGDPRPEVSNRALGWYQAAAGWLLSNPDIRCFNRHMTAVAANKPAVLCLAKRLGLRIPGTWLSNESVHASGNDTQRIAKPVAGGGYCFPLEEALESGAARKGRFAMPALIQTRLQVPEIRVYAVGSEVFAFEVRSESLDYRLKQDAELIPVDPPKETTALQALMAELGMDFGAADFKTDPEAGALAFLELNTSPMFARFDGVSHGELGRAMVRALMPGVNGQKN